MPPLAMAAEKKQLYTLIPARSSRQATHILFQSLPLPLVVGVRIRRIRAGDKSEVGFFLIIITINVLVSQCMR